MSESKETGWDDWRKFRESIQMAGCRPAGTKSPFDRRELLASDGHELYRNAQDELLLKHATRRRHRTVHVTSLGEDFLKEHGIGEGQRISRYARELLTGLGTLYTNEGYEISSGTAPLATYLDRGVDAFGLPRNSTSPRSDDTPTRELADHSNDDGHVDQGMVSPAAGESDRWEVASNADHRPFELDLKLRVIGDMVELYIPDAVDTDPEILRIRPAFSAGKPRYMVSREWDTDGPEQWEVDLCDEFSAAVENLFDRAANHLAHLLEAEVSS